jgi:hypothetical protein
MGDPPKDPLGDPPELDPSGDPPEGSPGGIPLGIPPRLPGGFQGAGYPRLMMFAVSQRPSFPEITKLRK